MQKKKRKKEIREDKKFCLLRMNLIAREQETCSQSLNLQALWAFSARGTEWGAMPF